MSLLAKPGPSPNPSVPLEQPHAFTSSEQTSVPTKSPQHPVDLKLEHLQKSILPSAPYLLRLKARSAQYHPRERYYWRKDTLFDEDEEELQYLTFRQTHDDTLLHAHGQWDDGNGGIVSKELPSSQASSGRTPVAAQVAKKKISLADYQKLDKSKPKTSDMNATAMKGPVEAPAKDVRDVSREEDNTREGKAKDEAKPKPKAVEAPPKVSDHARKRSADTMTGANDANVIEHGPLASPAKRSRLPTASRNDSHDTSIQAQSACHSPSAAHKAHENDKLMSKVGPASLEVNHSVTTSKSHTRIDSDPRHGLPPMLSPTLPADIEEELAKLTPSIRAGFVSSRVSSASPSVHVKDHKRAAPASAQAKPVSTAPPPSSPKQHPHDTKQITSAPRQQNRDSSVHIKRSKIVSLKIRNKGNRRILVQYLRMKPTPNRNNQHFGSKTVDSLATKSVGKTDANGRSIQIHSSELTKPSKNDTSSDTDEPLAKRQPNKRRPASSEDHALNQPERKRSRVVDQQRKDVTPDRSHTPRQQGDISKRAIKTKVPTPTVSSLSSSAQKTHLNFLSSAMQRTDSQDSVATPARDVTPTANGHKVESPRRREWLKANRIETSRLVKLATDIKHDSDAFLKHLDGEVYEKHRKIGSVVATEAVLCFVLAAMVSDETGRSSLTPTNMDLWKSTRDFIGSLSSNHAKKFQSLFGFLKQLEGIVCDTLSYQHDIRIDATLREYNRLRGQDSVVVMPNADTYIAENSSLQKEALETRNRSRATWREGQHALFDRDLEHDFPKTWSRRRSFPGRGKGRDPVTLKSYGKDGFALPLCVNSTGLDAVNFGLAFLQEFCEKEGLQWTPKLVL